MKKKILALIIAIAIPSLVGFLVYKATPDISEFYMSLNLPSFAPDAKLFGIIWPILYVLMGISAYLIYQTPSKSKTSALTLFGVQLLLNALWPILFFRFGLIFPAFIEILCLVFAVLLMLSEFFKINKTAAFLQIPYLIWILFASVLNYFVYLLN